METFFSCTVLIRGWKKIFLKFQNYLRTIHFEIYLFCSWKFNQILDLTFTARANEFVTLRGWNLPFVRTNSNLMDFLAVAAFWEPCIKNCTLFYNSEYKKALKRIAQKYKYNIKRLKHGWTRLNSVIKHWKGRTF